MRLPDLPVPEVTEGTVLVKAQAAALNPVDNALAAGTMAQMCASPVDAGHLGSGS